MPNTNTTEGPHLAGTGRPSEPQNPRSLGQRAIRGVLWTGGGQILRQVIQVVSQLALVRLLVPDDFGLLGMAMLFIGIGQLLADFGVGSAIVQARSSDQVVLSTSFWLNVLIAGVLGLIAALCSPLVAAFYQRSELVPMVCALSLNLLLSGLQVIPNALLYRDMRFGRVAQSQVMGSLLGATAAVGSAWAGAGVWALVVQPILGTSINLLWSWRATRWLPTLEFQTQAIRDVVRFSAGLLGSNLLNYVNRNVDAMFVGRVLGAAALGHYSMAIQLMLYPLQQVSTVIVRVLFPTLSHLQQDLQRFRSAYLRAVGTIAFVTFPLMGGLFALADDFVPVVLGQGWGPMIPALKVLSAVGALQSVATTVGAIYLAFGRTGDAFKVTMVATPVVALCVAAGLPWGIFGVAIGYALATGSLFYFTTLRAFRFMHLPLTEFHGALSRIFLSTLAMMAVLLIAMHLLAEMRAPWRLGCGVCIGVTAYAMATWMLNRAQLLDLVAIFASVTRRGRSNNSTPS